MPSAANPSGSAGDPLLNPSAARTLVAGSGVPFATTGPWNTPVPASATLDPQSSAIAANVAGQIQAYYGHAALNTYSYSAPVYTVPPGAPTVNVGWSRCQGGSSPYGFGPVLLNVPVPIGAVSSVGSDAEMVINQPSTDTEWEFWKMSQNTTTGSWSACWGGKISPVSTNPGVFPPTLGAAASGLPLLASLIKVHELQSGSVNHAIGLELPNIKAYAFSWPANRTDGGDTNPTDPAEGERLRLDPTLDLSTLLLSPGELTIARAMQTYGLIVTDHSGAVTLQGEDPRPYEIGGAPDPYTSFFSGPQYSWLKDIPWSHLQVLPWNYSQPASS